MKNILSLFLLFFIATAFTGPATTPEAEKKVKWYTWEEAVALQKTAPRKIMVDIYTDWCHWCKVMDKKTFEEKDIADYLNTHFYPVKLNAEQKADIIYDGNTFKYVKAGRRGVHTLAYSLLDGKMSYPSIVFLNEKMERVMISAGFKKPDAFKTELTYLAEDHYLKQKLNVYQTTSKEGS